MKLVVGLGNPGKEYAASRHNIGFRCIDHFASRHGIEVRRRKGKALVGDGAVNGARVVLAKPQTYMNASGESVSELLRTYGVKPQDLLVVYDDLDLPSGRVRIRPDGGAGGHHGMESIIARIGTQDFPRIRVGIGRPEGPGNAGESGDTIGYVLGRCSPRESKLVEEAVAQVSEAILVIVTEGLEKAMNRFNRPAPRETG